MKFAFYTLGCKTNQYETQAMERLLVDQGHAIGSFDESCDAYVINTCSVTAVADKKNRAIIRRCRRDNPDAVIGVCGCYSQHDAEAVRNLGVDVIGGSGQRQQFIDMLLEAVGNKTKQEAVDIALRRREEKGLLAGLWEFPHVTGSLNEENAVRQAEQWKVHPQELLRRADRSHIFTHIQWNLRAYRINCGEKPGCFTWLTPQEILKNAALPTAFRQFWDLAEPGSAAK